MSKTDENGLTPGLRFSEFANDGEWAIEKIENYIELFSGIALKSEEISDDESGTPILRGINITEGYIRHSKDIDKYFVGDLENLKKYLTKENDIVIGMDGSKVGKNVALVKKEDENSILIQRVARIRNNQKSDINYIYHHFISNRFRGYVDTVNTSSGIPHISAQQIKDFQIGFPPKLEEQQKIAACLSSLDEVISAENQKLDILNDHKRGLLQNLLPQEGETVPKFRFKEFEDSEEWQDKELWELGDLINGLTYSPNDVREKGLLVLRSSNIQNGQIDLKDCVFVDPKVKGANLTKTDDILVCVRNGSKALIGKNAIIPNNIPFATHGAFMTVFRAKYPKFIFQLFQTDGYNNQVKADLGATINSINGKNFLKYKFLAPKPEEQNKIASCLSSLDELIYAQSQKLDKLKLHKKGLLQGLFPTLNNEE